MVTLYATTQRINHLCGNYLSFGQFFAGRSIRLWNLGTAHVEPGDSSWERNCPQLFLLPAPSALQIALIALPQAEYSLRQGD